MLPEPRYIAKRYITKSRTQLPMSAWAVWDNEDNIFIEIESGHNMITCSTLKSNIDDFIRILNNTARYVIERFPVTGYGIWDNVNSEFMLLDDIDQNRCWNGREVSAFGVIDSVLIDIVEKLNNPV